MDISREIIGSLFADEPINVKPTKIVQAETPDKFLPGQRVQHVKTKRIYVISHGPRFIRIEKTGEPGYAYMLDCTNVAVAEQDKHLWIRSQSEMEDGRFVVYEK